MASWPVEDSSHVEICYTPPLSIIHLAHLLSFFFKCLLQNFFGGKISVLQFLMLIRKLKRKDEAKVTL
jgi:hypothetical protein